MTTTNGATTATVEVLTAEVRVLQVGSRQITLSVAKQLDEALPSEIEVFGRIKLNDWSAVFEHGYVELIGRHVETGALVTSCATPSGDGYRYSSYGVTVERYIELQALPLIVLAGLR